MDHVIRETRMMRIIKIKIKLRMKMKIKMKHPLFSKSLFYSFWSVEHFIPNGTLILAIMSPVRDKI